MMMSPPGARTVVDGVTYDYYGGTGYLGLQGHPEVIEAGCRAMRSYGVHSATSRSRYANPAVLNVERQAARFFGCERAFYLSSGYFSTGLLLQSVAAEVDALFLDAASHYSIVEAATASGLPVHTFRSRDHNDLQTRLAASLQANQTPLVLTDGVFASYGWIAPIDHYLEVLEPYHRPIILVDDAHGFGVLGPDGRGTLDHFGHWSTANRLAQRDDDGPRLFAAGTLSKALGGHGGIVPGDQELYQRVTSIAHQYDGASAPAAAVAAASARALQIVIATPELRQRLRDNTQRVRDGLRPLGIDTGDQPTPIVGFELDSATAMQDLHRTLAERGILLPYASAYSGLGAAGAMRLAVFATHDAAMIDRLLEQIAEALQ